VQLLRKDFCILLVPDEWLNDEVINFYMLLLQVGPLPNQAYSNCMQTKVA
jgi:Ulp1 family protease